MPYLRQTNGSDSSPRNAIREPAPTRYLMGAGSRMPTGRHSLPRYPMQLRVQYPLLNASRFRYPSLIQTSSVVRLTLARRGLSSCRAFAEPFFEKKTRHRQLKGVSRFRRGPGAVCSLTVCGITATTRYRIRFDNRSWRPARELTRRNRRKQGGKTS